MEMDFDPMLDGARRLPEFTSLAKRRGLVRYWRESGVRPDFCKVAGAPDVCNMLR